MSRMTSKGFTIIEVVLFLAITGLLVATLLIGFNATIERQKYRDGANSLLLNIQQQYSDAANIKNNRDSASCAASTTFRGQDECIVLGRYFVIDGGTFRANNILGHPTAATDIAAGDIAVLQSYNYRPDTQNGDYQTQLEWGVRAALPGSSTNQKLIVSVLRSPTSGLFYTFIRKNNVAVNASVLKSMVTNSVSGADPNNIGRSSILLCADPGTTAFAEKLSVRIQANASNASAVELMSNTLLQKEGATQC